MNLPEVEETITALKKQIKEAPDKSILIATMNEAQTSELKIALEKEGLAIIPGIAFGEDRCVRISCSVSQETINEGIIRLKRVIDNLL